MNLLSRHRCAGGSADFTSDSELELDRVKALLRLGSIGRVRFSSSVVGGVGGWFFWASLMLPFGCFVAFLKLPSSLRGRVA